MKKLKILYFLHVLRRMGRFNDYYAEGLFTYTEANEVEKNYLDSIILSFMDEAKAKQTSVRNYIRTVDALYIG